MGDSTCEECGGALESLLHLFWECTKAKETWSLFSLFPLLSMTHFSSFFDFLWHILMDAQWGIEESRLAVTIVWALWTNRNEVHHGKQRKAGMILLSWCKNYLDEYWNVSCLSSEVSAQQASHHLEANWSPPNYPLYKINVDGAVFSSQKAAGIGVIVRDYEGNFIARLSKKIHAPLGAIEVEAKALEAGIFFEKEVGIREFILEGDSAVTIQALKEVSHAPSSIASMIYGSLIECHEFRNVVFSHVRQQDNKTTHLLAKHALGVVDFSAWIEELPYFLEQALNHDISVPLIS